MRETTFHIFSEVSGSWFIVSEMLWHISRARLWYLSAISLMLEPHLHAGEATNERFVQTATKVYRFDANRVTVVVCAVDPCASVPVIDAV